MSRRLRKAGTPSLPIVKNTLSPPDCGDDQGSHHVLHLLGYTPPQGVHSSVGVPIRTGVLPSQVSRIPSLRGRYSQHNHLSPNIPHRRKLHDGIYDDQRSVHTKP